MPAPLRSLVDAGLSEGDRVRFAADHWQHICGAEMLVPAGSFGTVVLVDADAECGYVAIRLDEHDDALDEWDNEAQVSYDSGATLDVVA